MTDASPAERQRTMHLRMLQQVGRPLAAGARVLDFGCGRGATVEAYASAGFDAWGCDIALEDETSSQLRPIERPYRLPFEDASFDFVFSDQVFEHVQNRDVAIREIARILRPGGISLHIFPARWRPLEGHTFVPLAGVIDHPAWLRLWARLGVRNRFQRGLQAWEVVAANRRFLADETSYPSRRELRRAFEAQFRFVRFCEREFLENTWGRARALAYLAWVPGLDIAVSGIHTRAILAAERG